MKTQILQVNLNEQLLIIGHTVVGAYNSYVGKLFIKEGYTIDSLIEAFPNTIHERLHTKSTTVGHFGLTAFSFKQGRDLELTDFK